MSMYVLEGAIRCLWEQMPMFLGEDAKGMHAHDGHARY